MKGRETVWFNGIRGTDGTYLRSPKTVAEIADAIVHRREPAQPGYKDKITLLRQEHRRKLDPDLGGPPDIPPNDFTRAGWAVVFSEHESAEVKEALRPLIEYRRQQIVDGRTHVLTYRGEESGQWLQRHGLRSTSWHPEKVPFYLLVVGSSDAVPFAFTQSLAVTCCVGRLSFSTTEEYANYVASVIAYEQNAVAARSRAVAYFGTRHHGDEPTKMSADHLITPLADTMSVKFGLESRVTIGDSATRDALKALLRQRDEPPGILFTATHGVAFPKDDPARERLQGALLCADWRGLGSIERTDYLAGEDLCADANVHGLFVFLFACYSGATPSSDRYLHHETGIADTETAPFFSNLPQQLLSHPRGGALACISHIDQALATTVLPFESADLTPFETVIASLAQGLPVGLALREFRQMYVSASLRVTELLDQEAKGVVIDLGELTREWLTRNDAEGYLLLGDPATSMR